MFYNVEQENSKLTTIGFKSIITVSIWSILDFCINMRPMQPHKEVACTSCRELTDAASGFMRCQLAPLIHKVLYIKSDSDENHLRSYFLAFFFLAFSASSCAFLLAASLFPCERRLICVNEKKKTPALQEFQGRELQESWV